MSSCTLGSGGGGLVVLSSGDIQGTATAVTDVTVTGNTASNGNVAAGQAQSDAAGAQCNQLEVPLTSLSFVHCSQVTVVDWQCCFNSCLQRAQD